MSDRTIKHSEQRLLSGILLFLMATSVGAQSQVYRWEDENGVVHFSDDPPRDSAGFSAQSIVVPDPGTPFWPILIQAPESEAAADAEIMPASLQEIAVPSDLAVLGCASPSPLQLSGIDVFAELEELNEPTLLSSTEVEAVHAVLSAMVGRWYGEDVGDSCQDGGRGDIRPTTQRIVSEGDFDHRDEFLLDSTVSGGGSSHGETLRIAVRDQRLWVNSGDAALFSVSGRELSFGYMVRLAGAITEYYWRVRLNGIRGLTIELSTYAGGELMSFSIWELEKTP